MRTQKVKRQPWDAETAKELRRIAGLLPEIKRKRTALRVLTGSQLLQAGIKELNGKPIEPRGHYSSPYEDLVNHEKELRTYYARLGWPGVEQYKKEVIELTLKSYDKLPENKESDAPAVKEENSTDPNVGM
jgi:hypothetical protein